MVFGHMKLPFPQTYFIGLALVLILGGWFLFGNRNNGEETLTIQKGDFLQQVSVSGKVVAAQDVKLGFSQGGRISGLYTKVGSWVVAGTVLAEVENGDLHAEVAKKQAELEREEATLAALLLGTRPEEIALAEAEVARDKAALLDEIGSAYTTAEDAVRNQVDQFLSNPRTNPQLNITVADSQLKINVESRRLVLEKTLVGWQSAILSLTLGSNLSLAALEAQQNLAAVASLLTDANAALNKASPNGSVSQSTIDGYLSDVATARSNINISATSVTSAGGALDVSEKNLLLKQAGSTQTDIDAQQAQVRVAQAALAQAQAQLRKTLIIAPFSGVVRAIEVERGESVSQGEAVLSMIGNFFQVESFVPEINIALIALGNKVSVTLDAYGQDSSFEARVVSLDPAETLRDGVSTYRAIIEFLKPDSRIRAGMTATVVITTEEKEGVIAIPQGIIITRGEKKFVKVLQDGEVGEREVTIGSVSSLGNVEILSGLSEGEVVILATP